MRKITARDVLDRLHLVFSVKNDSQLCDPLGVNRSTVGSWVARESVPYAICVDISGQRGISLDWLLTGEGPMNRGADWVPGREVTPEEWELLDALRELDVAGRQAVMQFTHDKQEAYLMRQQMQALNDVLEVWAHSEGKGATETSGPLMDGIRKYLSLSATLENKKGDVSNER